MAIYTQGSWHVGGKGDIIIYDEDGNAVASAETYHGKHESGVAKANADLIAAAPDLLGALEALVLHGEAADHREGVEQCLELQQAKLLIAKVKGASE